jgi:hypothetical protein
MNYKIYSWAILSVISTLTIAAEERSTMKFDALPDAVRSTVAEFIEQANITKIEKVIDSGYVKFEIESTKTVDKKNFIDTDMVVATDGAIIKLAKEAPFFDIPFPVMKLLNQRYPNLKVDEVENVQTRYFQLSGKNNGQPVNLKVFDDGEIQDIGVDPDTNNNRPTIPLSDRSSDKPLMPNPGSAKLPNQRQDDALPIDHPDDIFHLNPNQ